MKVSLLNTRIVIQESVVIKDRIGNQSDDWQSVYECFATVSNESPIEQTDVGATWDNSKIDFTIRYSSEVSNLSSTKHRVVFNQVFYNIMGIDHMNYKKKSLKLHCQRVER